MSARIVITAVDDNYVLPLIVMLYSAKKNATHSFEVIIGYLEEDLSEENRRLINSALMINEIEFNFKVVPLEPNFISSSHLSRTSFARLYLADSLNGIALWLDADLICLSNWDEIFDFPYPNNRGPLLVGVKDPVVTHVKNLAITRNRAALKMGVNYFNTGVLLIDCDLWDKFGMPDKWRDALANYEDLGFQYLDQCILNYICGESYSLLPNKFNRLAFFGIEEPLNEITILHFAGPSKPWDYKSNGVMKFFSIFDIRHISYYLSLMDLSIKQMKGSHQNDYLILREKVSSLSREKSIFQLMRERILLFRNLPR